jgi:hypothetical protein
MKHRVSVRKIGLDTIEQGACLAIGGDDVQKPHGAGFIGGASADAEGWLVPDRTQCGKHPNAIETGEGECVECGQVRWHRFERKDRLAKRRKVDIPNATLALGRARL